MVRAHYESLINLAAGYVGSVERAQDVVHDVLATIWERHRSIAHLSSPRGYLFRAVRNRALNAVRDSREATDIPFERPDQDPGADDLAAFRDLVHAYRIAVDALPVRQREAYQLSRLHGLTYEDIAEVMGTSVNTVRSQIASALEHLRRALADYR